MNATAAVATPIGTLALAAEGDRLVSVEFSTDAAPSATPASEVLAWAAREIREYFAGTRKAFTVPLAPPEATPFSLRVWEAMAKIPYGETRTYGQLAAQLSTSARAVGGACRRNPLPLLIPCHRVVAKNGLGGYSGDWEKGKALTIKEKLLAWEQAGGNAG